MANQHPSPVRQQFACRLKSLRITRGFKTARSLATALGIDENRYTRYERAEVEPDLELIGKICSTLSLCPNDLLGSHSALGAPEAGDGPIAAFAEAGSGPIGGAIETGRARAAWNLARAVAELELAGQGADAAEGPPLAVLQGAARWFSHLQRQPYATVGEILHLPAVASAPALQAEQLRQLIETFVAEA